jgi:hypothetical protein
VGGSQPTNPLRRRPVPIQGTNIKLDTPEAIEAWIEERKRRWPTTARVAEKKRKVEEAIASGGLLPEHLMSGGMKRPRLPFNAEATTGRGRGGGRGDRGRGRGRGRGGRTACAVRLLEPNCLLALPRRSPDETCRPQRITQIRAQIAMRLRCCRQSDRPVSRHMDPRLPMSSMSTSDPRAPPPTRRSHGYRHKRTLVLAVPQLVFHLCIPRRFQAQAHVPRTFPEKLPLNPKSRLGIRSRRGHLYFVV